MIVTIPRPSNLLYFPSSNIRYTFILKNACSTVKATLLSREGVDVNVMDIDEVHLLARAFVCTETQAGRTLAVVRDPAKRFVSAFLDKIVTNPRQAVWRTVIMHPSIRLSLPELVKSSTVEELDIERLTFLDFARAVALIPDLQRSNF